RDDRDGGGYSGAHLGRRRLLPCLRTPPSSWRKRGQHAVELRLATCALSVSYVSLVSLGLSFTASIALVRCVVE
uniref:Uncharacterized protein n=1 Tax=Aegilops tauschii subsp. strangulata TaxID=200361 RepID=A0A453F695_AEGTS